MILVHNKHICIVMLHEKRQEIFSLFSSTSDFDELSTRVN